MSRCPPRSFPNQGGVCWACHESCETCAGAGQDSCLTCAPAHLHVVDLAVCLQVCPDGYYESKSNIGSDSFLNGFRMLHVLGFKFSNESAWLREVKDVQEFFEIRNASFMSSSFLVMIVCAVKNGSENYIQQQKQTNYKIFQWDMCIESRA